MAQGMADATLVAAGYRLGQSYIPGDYSKIFEKQYEGIIKANQAKAQAKIDYLKNLDKNVGDFLKHKKEGTDWLEDATSWFDDKLDTATTDYATGKMGSNKQHYENNGDLNIALEGSDNDYMLGMRDRYEKLHNKLILTKEEKKEKRSIEKNIVGFRNQHNNSKANINTKGVEWNNGTINKDLSFKGESDLLMLWTQVSDPNKDLPEGVRAFWENGERFYEYSSGGIGTEVKSTSENPGQYDFAPESSKKKNIISEKDLLARLQPKDTKAENDFNAIGTQVLQQVNKMITNTAGVKIFNTENFSKIEGKVQNDYYNVAMQSENPNDIYTRKIMIGNTPRVYKDDLELNRDIDVAVIDQMGIGSDVFTTKELEDGVIDPTELAKHKDAKAKIMETLTNPKTASQKEISAIEYSKYRKDMLEGVFNAERTRLSDAVEVETSEEIKEKERVYQQNSILIQEQFVAAEKKGFTLDILNGLPIDKNKQFVKVDGKVYLAYKTSVGDKYKMVSDSPIDLKNKQSVLNILYQNSKIRPRERNIKVTGGAEQANYVNSPEYLNKFIINKED